MIYSGLTDYVKLSPNCTKLSNKQNKKITIHHMAGNLTVEQCGNVFANPSRKASSNYAIGSDGRIACYVPEEWRAWTSSSSANDNQAITIEVANDEIGGEWHVSDKALNKLIELCVDICKRNKIESLVFTGDKNGNLTMHKYFAATACPGPYLESKFPYIADEVNKRLKGGLQVTKPVQTVPVTNNTNNTITTNNVQTVQVPFRVKILANELNIRAGAGTKYKIVDSIKDHGVYTIIETNSTGTWGKLKSGAGWISLSDKYTKRV